MSFNFEISKFAAKTDWSQVGATLKSALKALAHKATAAGAGLLESSPHITAASPRSLMHDHYTANFKEAYVNPTFEQTGHKPAQSEEDLKAQIGRDEKRYSTKTDVPALLKAINDQPNAEIRKNMLFANCQNFEIALANWCKRLYGSENIIRADNEQMTPISYNMQERTTTIKSSFQVLDIQTEDRIPKVIDRFKATAVFHWDSAQVDITRSPI